MFSLKGNQSCARKDVPNRAFVKLHFNFIYCSPFLHQRSGASGALLLIAFPLDFIDGFADFFPLKHPFLAAVKLLLLPRGLLFLNKGLGCSPLKLVFGCVERALQNICFWLGAAAPQASSSLQKGCKAAKVWQRDVIRDPVWA